MSMKQYQDDSDCVIVPPTRGVVRLPPGSTRVLDADEEVFLLYTNLAGHRTDKGGTAGFRGLGHIDSHEDTLTISINLGVPVQSHDKPERVEEVPIKRRVRTASQKRKARKPRGDDVHTLEVEIFQDKTALRSRKGDTGSVLWHASVDFAEAVLRQLHRKVLDAFLDQKQLSEAHVVELGAGTGLLSIVLSPFVRHYTVTDIPELVPLIRKNVGHNLAPDVPTESLPKRAGKRATSPPPPATSINVTATALDWVQLHSAPALLRAKIAPEEPADVVLVVDCIYHPSLLPALLTTIDQLTVPDRTAVIVVVELRAEDVIREFLQGWLDRNEDGEWEVWSVSGLLDGPYAVWVGWKDGMHGNDSPA